MSYSHSIGNKSSYIVDVGNSKIQNEIPGFDREGFWKDFFNKYLPKSFEYDIPIYIKE